MTNLYRMTPKYQLGFTLIELLVAIALGIVVITVVVISFLSTNLASNTAQAQGRMNEDAQMALEILSQEIRKAGYNPLRSAGLVNDLGQNGWNLFACDTGFKDSTTPLISGLQCNNAGTNMEIAIAYEADSYAGKMTNAAPAKLMDCIGNGITSSGTYFIVQARLASNGKGLTCRGSGDLTQNQTLVDNIESINMSFAVSDPSKAISSTPMGYLTATQLNAPVADLAGYTGVQRWNKVLAARICVVVRSEEKILNGLLSSNAKPNYINCAGDSVDINDGVLRRAYRTTVLLRNHGVGYVDK
ncbi:hypothetical protein os4_20680 [Comamonadaceae bacterium OS-4]|nr:hypothetical protein os4_20680 [Comamonadaceae bacterium OS-4]